MSEALSSNRAAFAAHADHLTSADPGFARFFAQTVDLTDSGDLRQLTPEEFEAVLRPSYALFGQRGSAAHLVSIRPPDETTPAGARIIDIFAEDMPFLVDSVLGALRAAGLAVRLFAHPILAVTPDEAGWQLRDPHEEGDAPRYESFVHIHVDPVADEDVLIRLAAEFDAILVDVGRVVDGWRPMLERLRNLVQDYRRSSTQGRQADLAEALHFLAWLADHNFTFLGMREYRLTGSGEDAELIPVEGSGLGILEDPDYTFLRSGPDYVEMTPQHVAFLTRPEPLLVTKANRRARVHRRGHLDYVGAKLYDDGGQLTGELRILGLFTSQSLHQPHVEVPFIRRKISAVMRLSGFDPKSHAGKALMAALDNYPREELFQISEQDLFDFASEIASLPDRPRVKVLPRIDPFDNFVSILVFIPRDRYTSQSRADIGAHLASRYDGRVTEYYPFFPEGDLVRVHFIIGRAGGKTPRPERGALEAEVRELLRSFGDRITEAAEDPAAVAAWREAFPAGYQSRHTHETALSDIGVMQKLADAQGLAVRLDTEPARDDDLILKFYHLGAPLALSDRVPMLENFGFRVIDETTYTLTPENRDTVYLHDMVLEPPDDAILETEADAARVEEAILAVSANRAENDQFSQLVLRAGLTSAEVGVLRGYGRYMRQLGFSFSQRYLADTLGRHKDVARALIALFAARLDPEFFGDRDENATRLHAEIDALLAEVSSLDEDRIIRHYRNLVTETLRTNYFQRDQDGAPRPALALKFNSPGVNDMPAPRPAKEIFVSSPRLEGVHLRFGDVARGGIRWSDRPEDFRTEVLGLVKAQQVKNAIIVPVGAKGGFVPKQMPAGADRDAVYAEGLACYEIFIGALLDLTDNLDGDTLIAPPHTVCADAPDPYLVVAADKGTARFSDTANRIATERHFWLGDAFASGGSAGYDHKKMGITARGAWESVKRHFRERNRDIEAEPISVVGVGDMSGDVFGNGMLLSRHIRLVAAFDHRDIFVDPAPDPERGFAERQRLFELPRSSWQDYNPEALSPGGGVYSRSAKAIVLSPEVQGALGLQSASVTPAELIRAILTAEVDLIWFGGIGTYVRAAGESNAEVGDRANDSVRVSADEINAAVIGEGANLGVTQRGRIAFAQRGGRINTDAIDNSAGVNSSDLEVNIKIALGALIRSGDMDIGSRDSFLTEMTDEVAALCLKNNFLQSVALSLAERDAVDGLPDHRMLIEALERDGHLDRAVEFLPDNQGLDDRLAAGKGLSRPELAVLLAYAKNTLTAELLASSVPDDPYLASELFRYFPDTLTGRHQGVIENHRLRREVIATVLANAMINRGGPAYVEAMAAATSAGPAAIAHGYAAARDSYDTTGLNAAIDALDTTTDGQVQLALYAEVRNLLVSQTLWFLRNVDFSGGLGGVITRYRSGIEEVRDLLGQLVPTFIAEAVADQAVAFIEGGAPRDLARRIAELSALTLASDAVLVAERHGASVTEATEAYFAVLGLFRLGRITEQGGRINLTDRFDRMALDRALSNLMRAVRDLAGAVLVAGEGPVAERFAAWHSARENEIDRIVSMVGDLVDGELTVSRLSVAAGLLSDLIRG